MEYSSHAYWFTEQFIPLLRDWGRREGGRGGKEVRCRNARQTREDWNVCYSTTNASKIETDLQVRGKKWTLLSKMPVIRHEKTETEMKRCLWRAQETDATDKRLENQLVEEKFSKNILNSDFWTTWIRTCWENVCQE